MSSPLTDAVTSSVNDFFGSSNPGGVGTNYGAASQGQVNKAISENPQLASLIQSGNAKVGTDDEGTYLYNGATGQRIYNNAAGSTAFNVSTTPTGGLAINVPGSDGSMMQVTGGIGQDGSFKLGNMYNVGVNAGAGGFAGGLTNLTPALRAAALMYGGSQLASYLGGAGAGAEAGGGASVGANAVGGTTPIDLSTLANGGVQDFGLSQGALSDATGSLNSTSMLNGSAANGLTSGWQSLADGTKVMIQNDGSAIGMNTGGSSFALTPTQVGTLTSAGLLNSGASGYVAATGGAGNLPGGGSLTGGGGGVTGGTVGGTTGGVTGGGGGGNGGGGGIDYTGLMTGLAGMYSANKIADQQKAQFDKINSSINGMYSPGSPEYQALQDQMTRADAASGRLSQYGARAVDIAGKVAGIKSNAYIQSLGAQNNMLNSSLMNQNAGLNQVTNAVGSSGLNTAINSGINTGVNYVVNNAGSWLNSLFGNK